MEYNDLNNYLKSLQVKTETETKIEKKDHKQAYATIDYLQRDLTLFNDMNSNYNAINANKIESEYQTKEDYKKNDMNSRLDERGLTPGNSIFSGRNGPLQNVVIDMTPLSTRVISKDKNKQ